MLCTNIYQEIPVCHDKTIFLCVNSWISNIQTAQTANGGSKKRERRLPPLLRFHTEKTVAGQGRDHALQLQAQERAVQEARRHAGAVMQIVKGGFFVAKGF